jgi:hypothetical protein
VGKKHMPAWDKAAVIKTMRKLTRKVNHQN